MKLNNILMVVFLTIIAVGTAFAGDKAKVGEKAPNFTLVDSNGNEHSLSDFSGKYVVLEWINYDCPFVVKHYDSGNMQKLQKWATEKDVVWLAICSSAEGKQGNFTTDEINKRNKDQKANFTAYLIDESGKVGKMYDARTTPNMYVINPNGELIYAGAIDSIKSTNQDDIKNSTNYVKTTLEAAWAGKSVDPSTTQPYGCGVKYNK